MTDPHPTPASQPQRAARRYVAVLLCAIVAFALLMAGTAIYLQPAIGDLTRIGARSERSFGPAGYGPVPVARPALVSLPPDTVPTAGGGIVIFGDSFSIVKPDRMSWIDQVQQATALPVTVARGDFRLVRAYLASEAFRADPPRAIIVETVERYLVERAVAARDPGALCPDGVAPVRQLARPLGTPDMALRDPEPVTRFDSLDALFLRAVPALRRLFVGAGTEVVEVGLSRDDLFSSRSADRLLIYGEDVSRHVAGFFGRPVGADMACGLRQVADLAGAVPLIVVVAPDKRTVYDAWITDDLPRKAVPGIDLAAEALGDRLVDLRPDLIGAVMAGTRDVYLPNDTHWGEAGHRIAGAAVARRLLAPAR